ncbi:IclR family transcriptional regulator [Nocardia jinanensis]|uniref:Transcriptional regulator n=1 Tax=Nocardia jinanensis TaxID=382504 RepID=A0A917RVW5_9NOCA|nr:IclR family transcriptional regulator [Nocardia jinanensis]GGL41015.1 transcriptional regulator [Nocardia jinanensis]
MGNTEPKMPPAYVVTSADHALRAAVMLQLEGGLTVSQVAERLGVARSTAHRLLQTLVYRDFAVQDQQRVYYPGPVLELATHSQSRTSRLRAAALPHLQRLVDLVGESANLTIRTGDTARFIASVECRQALRVGSREGMVFPAHRTTAGLVLLAELGPAEVDELYDEARYTERPDERPDLPSLRARLAKVRRTGFALNNGLSERGVVAVGVAVRDAEGMSHAGLSVSMPSVRYDRNQLPTLVATLHRSADAIEAGRGGD